jgi:hypothetical protein
MWKAYVWYSFWSAAWWASERVGYTVRYIPIIRDIVGLFGWYADNRRWDLEV